MPNSPIEQNHNILSDPLTELTQAIESHAFGLRKISTLSKTPITRSSLSVTKLSVSAGINEIIADGKAKIIKDLTFPITERDRSTVRNKVKNRGETPGGVFATARLGLVDGGEICVVLDKRGFTIESSTSPIEPTGVGRTFESLDTLLIAVSPGYVRSMGDELSRRFGN